MVAGESRAVVYLGDYSLGQVDVCAVDVPSLNRALLQVRYGQARRIYWRRLRKSTGSPLGQGACAAPG
jgi:hypothetical protein